MTELFTEIKQNCFVIIFRDNADKIGRFNPNFLVKHNFCCVQNVTAIDNFFMCVSSRNLKFDS